MYEKYMELALELAKKGKGAVNPNPLVGAVIVKKSKVIGQGYHSNYGGNHAEINAINSCNEDLEGSTMYVTLEPCCHQGKTPPCVDEIIKRKISKVVIGCLDPNPLVSGKGARKLKENNIEVVIYENNEECQRINEVFIKYISQNIPFVIMKCAMSLDGKIATNSGQSKWISSEESRLRVHQLRNEVCAIMVGVNTVITDNPKLTCRFEKGKNPIRIIVDISLKIPLESNVVNDNEAKTIIVTTSKANKDKLEKLKLQGVDILITELKNEKIDLKKLMKKLGELNIDSILLEGGSTLNFSALEEKIVDKVQLYIAPIIIGGSTSKTPVGGCGIKDLKDVYKLDHISTEFINKDILIEGYINR